MKKHNILIGFIIFIIIGLAGCSFNKPEKTIVLNLAALSSGVLLAQEKPELAQEILKYSNALLDTVRDTEILPDPDFNKWVQWIIGKLDIHPLLKVNFSELIKLVNIEIELAENQQEIVKLAYKVIQNFIKGIEAAKQ